MTTTPQLELVAAYDLRVSDSVVPEGYDEQLTLADYDAHETVPVLAIHRELHDGEMVVLTLAGEPPVTLGYETLVMRVRRQGDPCPKHRALGVNPACGDCDQD